MWPSAPMDTAWLRRATTTRCDCGTPTPASRVGAPLTGHTDDGQGRGVQRRRAPPGQRRVDGTVRLWNADTGQPLDAADRPQRRGLRCGVQPRRTPPGQRRVDDTVRLWNADTGRPVGTVLTGHTEGVNGVTFSPDGRRLATASDDRTVRLWNADTGQPGRRCSHRA